MNIEDRLIRVCKEIEKHNLTVEGISLMNRNAEVLFEHRWIPDYPRNIYSNTKCFTSAAVGMAIHAGLLKLSDKPYDFFCNYCHLPEMYYLREMTLQNLLTMSSGHEHPKLMYFDIKQGVGVDNFVEYLMNQPVKSPPGKKFLYSTGDSILAGAMVEKVVGCSLLKYLYNNFFKQMNMAFPIWETDLAGHCCGGSGLFLSLTDMMKLGVLYLNNGCIDGKTYFGENWVKESTTSRFNIAKSDDSWSYGYGYFWRVFPDGQSFRSYGVFGQDTIVIPKINRIIGIQCAEETKYDVVKDILNKCLFEDLEMI